MNPATALDSAAAGTPNAAAHATAGTRAAAAESRFEQHASEWLNPRSRRRSRQLLWTVFVITALLLVWSAFAAIEEVTRGDARVVSSRQLQSVQSLDGGVVAEILVREGQVVEKGQLLLKIDETRATSGARESAAQGLALKARIARLKALAEGSTFQPPTADPHSDDARVVAEEARLFETRRAELSTQLSIVQQQVAQRQQELSEMKARRTAAERALDLSQQELNRTKPLLASGAVSEVDVIRLERDIARARGESEQAAAQIQRVLAAVSEANRKLAETELSFRNEARKELAEMMGKLNALTEGAVALNDKVDKSQIRSPVRGRVQKLHLHTVGGVVTPGKPIIDVVPLDDTLVLEAKVHPRDIAFIHPGQAATVKFTAYDYSVYGGMSAKVENISPDTEMDDRGNAFYVVRVVTDQTRLDERLPIIPGMTADVDVLTGRKTVLSYLLKPVLKVREQALRER